MRSEIITVGDSEEDIFMALDDSLFFGEITRGGLRDYSEVPGKLLEVTEFDQTVARALGRALGIIVPDGVTMSVMNGKNKS